MKQWRPTIQRHQANPLPRPLRQLHWPTAAEVAAIPAATLLVFLAALGIDVLLFAYWGVSFFAIGSTSDVVFTGLIAILILFGSLAFCASTLLLPNSAKWAIVIMACGLIYCGMYLSILGKISVAGFVYYLYPMYLSSPACFQIAKLDYSSATGKLLGSIFFGGMFAASLVISTEVQARSTISVAGVRPVVQSVCDGGQLLWQGSHGLLVQCSDGSKKIVYSPTGRNGVGASLLVISTATVPPARMR